MEDRKQLWALQLVKYFLDKGYIKVSVVNKLNANLEEDYWLINYNKLYSVIHIHDKDDGFRANNFANVLASYHKIKEFINEENSGKCLDISLNLLASDYDIDEIEYVALHPGKEIAKLKEVFPEIETVLKESSNAEEEIVKIKKEMIFGSSPVRKQKAQLKERLKEKSCLTFIIPTIICVIVWLAVMFITYYYQTDSINAAIMMGALYKAFITILGEWWRLITSGFVHISAIHLLCNLMALHSFAYVVEKEFGFVKTMAILLIAIIAGSALEFIGGKNGVVVGLSGGIYGLFGAYTINAIMAGSFKDPIFKKNYLSNLYINIIISLMPQVSLMGHLGGFLIGGFMAVIFNKHTEKTLKTSCAVCLLIICLCLGFMGYKNQGFVDYYYGTDMEVAKVVKKVGFDKYANRILTETYNYYLNGGK